MTAPVYTSNTPCVKHERYAEGLQSRSANIVFVSIDTGRSMECVDLEQEIGQRTWICMSGVIVASQNDPPEVKLPTPFRAEKTLKTMVGALVSSPESKATSD